MIVLILLVVLLQLFLSNLVNELLVLLAQILLDKTIDLFKVVQNFLITGISKMHQSMDVGLQVNRDAKNRGFKHKLVEQLLFLEFG